MKVDFDQYTKNYNELLHDGTKFFSPSEEYFARYKVDVVRQTIAKPVNRILEYGCGIGRNIPALRHAFPGTEVVGTDISAASLEIARTENPESRFEVEAPNLHLGTFDLIFVAGVFHHIPPAERTAAIKTLSGRLADGGSLFVFEHNPYNPVTRRIVSNCPYDADAVLLKPVELRNLFSSAELKVRASRYCLFIPPRFSSIAGIEKHIGWLPLGGQYWIYGEVK
ncbi:MAG TPA: class I SAM-dependent methyltransferase [Stenotrophomonas sp.]|nr:class I SAM-dependent methyltransferase [Stenotrophomonas sp.]